MLCYSGVNCLFDEWFRLSFIFVCYKKWVMLIFVKFFYVYFIIRFIEYCNMIVWCILFVYLCEFCYLFII